MTVKLLTFRKCINMITDCVDRSFPRKRPVRIMFMIKEELEESENYNDEEDWLNRKRVWKYIRLFKC